MILSLFEFGTVWFWLVSVIAIITIVSITEHRRSNYWASLVFIAALVLFIGGNRKFFEDLLYLMITYPGISICIAAGYFVAGTVWSIFKWFFYLRTVKEKYESPYRNINDFYISHYSVRNNFSRIINWMIFWPFSLVWTIINDPVRKIFKTILSSLEGVYDSMAQRILGDLEKKKDDQIKGRKI